jgi:hypothetical protein
VSDERWVLGPNSAWLSLTHNYALSQQVALTARRLNSDARWREWAQDLTFSPLDTYFEYREDGVDEPGRLRKNKGRYDYVKKLRITEERASAKGPKARRIAEALFGEALGLIAEREARALPSAGPGWAWLLDVATGVADDKAAVRSGRRPRL